MNAAREKERERERRKILNVNPQDEIWTNYSAS